MANRPKVGLSTRRVELGPVTIAIVALALFTAGVHASFVPRAAEPAWVRISFLGVAVGYVVLLAVRYAPPSELDSLRPVAHFLLIGLTVALIVGYFVVGSFDLLGNVTKIAEVALVAFLVIDALRGNSVFDRPR
jgi:hypothetical protein